MDKSIPLLISCDERYNRHLANISCWTYEFRDYSYIREKIWEFVNIKNNNFSNTVSNNNKSNINSNSNININDNNINNNNINHNNNTK